MKANRAFRLIVTREDSRPAFLAGPERSDRIEIVDVQDGEPVLFWSLPAREAAALLRDLRTDLASLDAAEFLNAWADSDGSNR